MDTFTIITLVLLSLCFTTSLCAVSWLWSTLRAERAASSTLREEASTRSSSERTASAKIILMQAKQIKRLQRQCKVWEYTAAGAVGIRMHQQQARTGDAAQDQSRGMRGRIVSPREAIRRDKERRAKEAEPPKMQEPTQVPPRVAQKFLRDTGAAGPA